MPRGFVSKAQWRKFFADSRLQRYAHKEAHKTPGGPKIRYRRLPQYVAGSTRRAGVRRFLR